METSTTKTTRKEEGSNKKSTMKSRSSSSYASTTSMKVIAACVLLVGFASVATSSYSLEDSSSSSSSTTSSVTAAHTDSGERHGRRLEAVNSGAGIEYEKPSYMNDLQKELKGRKKLFDDTPPEEVKYWFEYTGELQKYFYRFSKSRGKADYFEGRDDSGVTSSRFFEDPGAGKEFEDFFLDTEEEIPDAETSSRLRLLENCMFMGHPDRPNTEKGTIWNDWFGGNNKKLPNAKTIDRCRILFTINTVGAGRGTTMLWETAPPTTSRNNPKPWQSEQETASSHLERNLMEIDSMCKSGQIAARVQILVCEPISSRWTEWMDSMLVNCGGKPAPQDGNAFQGEGYKVEERASPVQVVVVASSTTADTCHDLKSGFMEKRMQDLVLAPPYISSKKVDKNSDPSIKTTHPDLISSDNHDLYVALKWSSLVTIRSVNSFLQASADLAVAAASPDYQTPVPPEKTQDGVTVAISNAPSSPFLIPSFVRVSYVSEESSKVAKWRMHGDFFHPAAWEICRDSFETIWIPHSLAGSGKGICYDPSLTSEKLASGDMCGQWWVFFAELQMPTSPDVFANEATSPFVDGGSNYFWMVTERQRREVVKGLVCEHNKKATKSEEECPKMPQAVMPLGDIESFLINYTPNTALGKKTRYKSPSGILKSRGTRG